MTRGHPDWGLYPSLAALSVYEISGEQAARLGSPVNMFRDGLVCFMDDFRHGLGAWTDASLNGGAVKLVATPAPPHSPFALQLDIPATASAQAKATTTIPYPPTNTLGIQIVAQTGGTPYVFLVEADIYTGTRLI